MYTWISRVLLLVFSFQVIAPQLVQAQAIPYGIPGLPARLPPEIWNSTSYRTMDVPTDSLEDKIRAVVEQAKAQPFSQAKTLDELDQLYHKYRKELLDLYDTIDVDNNMANYSALYDVVLTLHKLSDEYYPHLKKFQAHAEAIARAEERKRQMLQVSLDARPVIVNDATYVASSASGKFMTQQRMDFLLCSRFSFPSDSSAGIDKVLDEVGLSSKDLHDLKTTKATVNDFPDLDTALKNAGFSAEDFSNYLQTAIDVDDLVEGIDPFPEMKTESGMGIACAAEMLIHKIDELLNQSSLSEEDTDFWTDYLPRLSARMQYTYYRLPDVTSSTDPYTILMVGSYRVLLYKVHQLYKKLGLQDPFTWKRVETDVPVYKIRPDVLTYNAYVENYKKQVQKIKEEHQKKPKRMDAPRDIGPIIPPMLSLQEFQAKGERTVTHDDLAQYSFQLPWGYENAGSAGREHRVSEEDDEYQVFHHILDKFKSEFYAIKNNKETKPGTTLYASLHTQVETMLTFSTTIGESSTLGTVVVTFDEEEKVDEITKIVTPSPLMVEHSDLIQVAFNTVVSTLKNLPSNDTAAIKNSKEKIVSLAGPTYSTATRITAIGAAGLLNKAPEWTEQGSQDNPITDEALTFDQETREKLVGYAADFYKDLNPLYNYYENYTQEQQDIIAGKSIRPTMAGATEHTSQFKRLTQPYRNYGLDSKQMIILQDQLVTDIHNLLPVNAPGRTWNASLSRYQATQTPILLKSIPENNGKTPLDPMRKYNFKSTSEYPFAIPTYVYDSQHKIVTLYLHNPINKFKQSAELAAHAWNVFLEAVLWIVGGEVFSLGIRALHLVRGMAVMLPAAFRSSRTVARSMRLAGKSAKEIRRARIGRFSSKLRQGRQYAVSLSSRGQNIGAVVTSTTREETIAANATRKAINKAANQLRKTENKITKYASDPTKAKKVERLREKAAQLEREMQRMGTQARDAAQALEKSANKLSKKAERLRRKAGKRSGKTGDRLRKQADDLEQQAAALREQAEQVRAGTGAYTADVTRTGYKYAGPRSSSTQREADRWARRMRNKMKGQAPRNNVGWNVSQHRLGYDLREIYIDAAKYRLEYANPGSWRHIVDNAKFWNAFAREGGEVASVFKSALPINIGGRTLLTLPFDPLADFKLAREASTLSMVGKGIQNMDGSIAFFTSKGEPATFEQVWAVMKDAPENLLKNRQEFLRLLEIKPGATAADVERILNTFQTKWEVWQAAYEKAATRLAGGKIPPGQRDVYYHMVDEKILSLADKKILAKDILPEFQAFENPLTDFQRFQAIFKTYESTAPEFFYAVPRANFPGGKIPTKFDPEKTPGVTRIVQNMVESPTPSMRIGVEAPAVEFISHDPAEEINQMYRFLREYSRYSGLTPLRTFHNNWIVSQVRSNFMMFAALDLTTDRWLYNLMEKQTDYRSNKQYKKAQMSNDPALDEKQRKLGYEEGEDDASNLFSRLYDGRSRLNERLFTTYSFMWPVPSQNPIPDLLWTDLLTDEDRANIQLESIRTSIDYLTTLREWNTKVSETEKMLANKRASYKKARSAATDPTQIQMLDTLLAELDKAEQDLHSFATDPQLTFAQQESRLAQWAELTDLITAEDDFQRQLFIQRVAAQILELEEMRQDYEAMMEDDTEGIYTALIQQILSEIDKMKAQLDAIVASEQDVFEKQNALDEWLEQSALQKAVEALRQKQLEAETADYLEALNQKRQELQESLTGQELADELADIDQVEQALRGIMQKPGTTKQKYAAWNEWQVGHFNEKAEQQHQRLEEYYAGLKHKLDQAIVHGNLKEVRRLKQMFTQQEQYATLLRNIQESSANVSYKDMWLEWWKDVFPDATRLVVLQEQLSFVNADEKTRQAWITAKMEQMRSGLLYSSVEKYAFLMSQLETVEGYSEDDCASVLIYNNAYSSREITYPELSEEEQDFWAKHQIDSALLRLTESPTSFGKRIESFGEDAIAQRDELWRKAQEEIDNIYNNKTLTLQEKKTKYATIRSSFSYDLQTLWNGLSTAAQREADELLPDENSTTSPIIH